MSDWRSTWHPAPGPLAEILAGIWSVRAGSEDGLSARVLPDGSTCLVFQADGTTLRSGDAGGSPWDSASVSGPRTAGFDFELGPAGRILIVQLRPQGAMQALGVPMSALRDRFEPLDAVVGAASRRLDEAVLGGVDDARSVRAVEAWLTERMRKSQERCPITDAVVAKVVQKSGNIRVGDLARHVNLSRRHLGRILTERVGTPPKLFARIARFDHAVRLGRFRPAMSWAAIALDGGYADQAHMIREFSELGGIRPGDLRGEAAALIW